MINVKWYSVISIDKRSKESKELLYSKKHNLLLPNNLSRTINVEMTTERYNKYRIWVQLGCPIPHLETQQDRSCEMIPSNNRTKTTDINESHTIDAIVTYNEKNENCHDKNTQHNAQNLNTNKDVNVAEYIESVTTLVTNS